MKKEQGQHGCENYPNFRPKRKRTPKKKLTKTPPRKAPKRKFTKKKTIKPKKAKTDKAKTEKFVNKPQKSSKHYRHEKLSQESFNPENKYYKRNKKPTACQCWNCGEIGHKSIDCTKRKDNIVRLFSEEFEEIQHELYLIISEKYDIISSCCECISSEEETEETETSEEESYSETENES